MERLILERCTFSGVTESAKIVIDKNGMRVEDKKPEHRRDDDFIRLLLSDCIDMDSWNHSWHMDVQKARTRRSKERKDVRQTLLDKIKSREAQIQKLKDAIQVLGRWHW